MVSVDEHTNNVIEIAGQGAKLTEELILKILRSLNELFEKDTGNKDFVIKDDTKEGKQKIKDLLRKHKDGVMAFDDNITKEQVQDYQKEFKKMGVDFSIVKNDADSYSFFFASRDANIIEKALKNIIEKKNKNLENEKEIIPEDKEVIHDDNVKKLEDIFNELSPQQRALFMKIDEIEIANKINNDSLNEIKKGLTQEQVTTTENLYKEIVFTGNDVARITEDLTGNKEKNIPMEQQVENIDIKRNEIADKFSSKELQLDSVFKQLDPLEKELFIQINKSLLEKGPAHKEFHKLMEIREKLTPEQIISVNKLHELHVFREEDKVAPRGTINIKDIEGVANNLIRLKEKQADKEKSPPIYSIKGVREIDKILKENEKNNDKDKKRTQSLSR